MAEPFPITEDQDKVAVTMPAVPNAGESRIECVKARPELRFTKWDREADLSVRYNGFSSVGIYSAERMAWIGATQTMRAYSLAQTAGREEGGYELELILAAKPASNRFDFTLSGVENLDFFPQPALTAEEIALGAFRPDNVVDSLAVYHKTVRNYRIGAKNYATGKAFHMYRPEAVDAIGRRQWLTQIVSGTLWRIVCPQSFLDTAVYPVTIGPTLGYTSIGASVTSDATSRGVVGHTPAASENGTVTNISVYGRSTSGACSYVMCLYDEADPGDRKDYSAAGSRSGAAAWITDTVVVGFSIVSGTKYYVGHYHNASAASGNMETNYDTGAASDGRKYSSAYSSPPPVSASVLATGTELYSAYITHTAAGGGLALPVVTRQYRQRWS